MSKVPKYIRSKGWKRNPNRKGPKFLRVLGWTLNPAYKDDRYSPHFTHAELDCHCGCKTPAGIARNLTKLAADLEKLRLILGPFTVISGYRCPAYNKNIHGASKSQHLTGNAADLGVKSGQQDRYVRAAERVPAFRNGGIGVYPNGGVHVDRRGYRARWNDWVRS